VRPAKSRVRPHLFVVDPGVPGCCARCHLPGAAGDKRHTLPVLPSVPLDVHQLRAGESAGAE
jgi:hypothetical protein